MKQDQNALTKRSEDQSKWYTEVVQRAQLADYSPVRGCMVIRPYGYAIWEKIQEGMNKLIKEAGVQNAYFPLFIPYSFLEKEADHVEGFAPEVAVVTHAGGEELEEKLVVRPTSETIIYRMMSEWIQSYRDLPMLLNQWANIVRWEKRTTPFLRTTEFLWQEGHTAHATKEEADAEVRRALDMYHDFSRDVLAMYTIRGFKTEAEKFAGGDYTAAIEGMMKDGKALQCGTSHLLSQSFAKAFDVKFLDQDGQTKYVWTTSWGFSTRIIGGLIMMHGDDKGLVLPPNIAPIQVRIVPIFNKDNESEVMSYIDQVESAVKAAGVSYDKDLSDNTPGFKFAEAEMKGIPVRVEVGGRDKEAGVVTIVVRYSGEKKQVKLEELSAELPKLLQDVQTAMYKTAQEFTQANITDVNSEQEFMQQTEKGFGYIRAYFCGEPEIEKQIKEKTKYTTRCVPFETYDQEGKCFMTGKSGKLTLFARAY